MQTPIFGEFEGPKDDKHWLGPIQTIDFPMRTFKPGEEVDFVIVGVGSGGGVMLQRLARAGFRVIGFDAGPFWDTERDWVSDEAGSSKLYWNELRITGGPDPITLGANNSGRGVGGGSVHWAGFTPRLHPSDFRVYSEDGIGVDWPIDYAISQARTTNCLNAKFRSPARPIIPGASRTVIPMARTRWEE